MGLLGNVGGFLGQLGGMGDAFAQAGAMMSGEWGAAADIAQRRSQLQGLKAKQQSDAAEQEQIIAGLMEQGLTRSQAVLVARNAASMGDFRAPQPDEFDKMMERAGIAKGSPQYAEAAKRKAMGDPYLTGATLPNGGTYYGYASGLNDVLGSVQGQQQGQPPARLPGNFFDQQGGPTQPASGGFRYRR